MTPLPNAEGESTFALRRVLRKTATYELATHGREKNVDMGSLVGVDVILWVEVVRSWKTEKR
jgi:hypothetical protein